MNETEQIRRAQQGDNDAWTALVQQQQQSVFRLAYLLLGNADDAEDVAQESFLRAHRALDRFDAERPLRPWLLRITKNLAHNRRRSLRRYLAALARWRRAAPVDHATGIDTSNEPAAQWAARERAESTWRAVQQLSPRDQEVIYLRYFLTLSVAEAAQALGVAEGTLKSRTHRALGRLSRRDRGGLSGLAMKNMGRGNSRKDANFTGLERQLRNVTRDFVYPPTPDMAAHLRRLNAPCRVDGSLHSAHAAGVGTGRARAALCPVERADSARQRGGVAANWRGAHPARRADGDRHAAAGHAARDCHVCANARAARQHFRPLRRDNAGRRACAARYPAAFAPNIRPIWMHRITLLCSA